ncbi:cytochrome P450 [Endozoicomonas numazuensis]|uniref:cytochrome P450 n=1 Tax=Endozoicomonas numazuensis TaxID=1137799 RepID=UPI0009DCCB8F|nr:cytochrome P450 [Endozoicomonas numazuensis]
MELVEDAVETVSVDIRKVSTDTPVEALPPIEEVFNPHSKEYCENPIPQCMELKKRGRLVWYSPWQAWIMTQITDIMECWRTEYLSSDFYDWEFAPARPPEAQWTNFERAMIGHSLVADKDHHRLIRKVSSPAFSRNVVDAIQKRIEPDVVKLFDDLGEPETFDYMEKISNHIPFISITRMVGIPEKYWDDFKPVVTTFTEAWNATISEERRAKAREDSNRAIDIIKQVIAERRESPQQDDFLSALIQVEKENPDFQEWDIITLILALIGAGADTTLVAQQWSVYALLKHKDQAVEALESPESFAKAFTEIMRWAQNSKMGFARYAQDDMDVLGQQVRKGQMVLMMPHLKDYDSQYFDEPETFNIHRKFDPDVLFGYGPRFCIGAALARRQLYLTMSELFKRFPDAELAFEPEKDETDHNSVAFKELVIKTNIKKA